MAQKSCIACGKLFEFDPDDPHYMISPVSGAAMPQCPTCAAIPPVRSIDPNTAAPPPEKK